eukprot:TRINITY_DN11163_c0_g1_i1.p1 TRINITY_DN11163_c0_g1~~TRINITY_DN11163_c0_g1_i1.p1  ORF type:complete len:583 (+),score=233.34 TRINITY_DN11163_c0_g1_i1:215-1750(+)
MTKIEQQLARAREMKEQAMRNAAAAEAAKPKRRMARMRESRVMNSTTHWSEKKMGEMKDRDWKIFREDFEIQVLGGGSSCPFPIRSWEEAYEHDAIPPKIYEAVRAAGYKHPSPVQMACIPVGLRRHDLIGLAETGSGKTCAFVVPLVVYVSEQPPMTRERREDGPYALILCPSRELAWQIEEECARFCDPYGFRTVSIVGGVSPEEQAQEIRKGADVVIGTPGRLVDLLDNKYLVLSQCNYVVLDEADTMIKERMGEQVVKIFDSMPSSNMKPVDEEDEHATKVYRVTVMFSSTMAPALKEIADSHLRRPVKVKIGLSSPSDIQQKVVVTDAGQKQTRFLSLLRNILEVTPDPLVLIFRNGRDDVEQLAYTLADEIKASSGFMHGSLTQKQREEAVKAFAERKTKILVATDVLGRGIDIKAVTHVVNYDMPATIDKYSQRIGRTGRAGMKGDALSLVVPGTDDKIMYDLVKKLEGDQQDVPRELTKNEAARVDPKLIDINGKRIPTHCAR